MTRVRGSASFITPRALPYEVNREHLISDFDGKYLLIIAPSGFGKTTLAAQWSRKTAPHSLWYNFVLSDQDPIDFTLWLARGIEQNLEVQLNEFHRLMDFQATPEKLILHLVDQLNGLTYNVRFVFDNIHVLSQNLLKWLGVLVASLGEGHQVCICGYEDLLDVPDRTPSLVRMVGPEDLKLSSAELSDLQDQLNVDADLQKVSVANDGWTAGIVMEAQGHKASQHARPIDVLLNRLDPALGQVLPMLALSDTWHARLPSDLQLSFPADWLKSIIRAGFPMTPIADGVYRPHQILRSALLRTLELDA